MKLFLWLSGVLIFCPLTNSYSRDSSDVIEKNPQSDSLAQKRVNDSILNETIQNNKINEKRLEKSEKTTLGVISLVGGIGLSVVGILDKTFPVESCDQESIHVLSGCSVDQHATDEQNTRGNIFLTSGLGMIGLGIFSLLWAQ